MTTNADDGNWDQRIVDAAGQIRRHIASMHANPRRRARGVLFQGVTNQEIERHVVRYFADSDLGKRMRLCGLTQLRAGDDPPDFRATDHQGAVVGLEVVELVDEQEQKTNVHRIKSALQQGGHDHSVPAPPWATAAFERLCRENPVTRDFTLAQAVNLLQSKLESKDAKIARKKQVLGAGWTFDWIGLVVFTLNPSIASGAFYQHVASAPFGPLQHIDRAFLVAEPFPVTLDPGGICEGVMEIPLRPRT